MKKIIATLCTLPLLGAGLCAAQDDSAPNLSAVEIYSCNYNKGKGEKDLGKVVAKWNNWADETGYAPYNAWSLTSVFNSPDYSFDVGWLGAWENGAQMGKGLQQWKKDGGAMQAEFDKVVNCSSHVAFTSANLKAPAQTDWPTEGVTAFSDCKIAPGKKLEDAIKVHAAWANHLSSEGSKAGLWMFLPSMGSFDTAYDYKIVVSHPDFVSLGIDNNAYTNGRGWEKGRELVQGVVSCGVPRVYNSRLLRNGGVNVN
jgi:hypothetical protein